MILQPSLYSGNGTCTQEACAMFGVTLQNRGGGEQLEEANSETYLTLGKNI